jgi:hypothetical protein
MVSIRGFHTDKGFFCVLVEIIRDNIVLSNNRKTLVGENS